MNPNRRKLIQGTLAAPVVMTVTPALGAAQTSLMACFDNSAAKPVNSVAPLASMNQDEWLRVELNVLEVSLPNGKGEAVVFLVRQRTSCCGEDFRGKSASNQRQNTQR